MPRFEGSQFPTRALVVDAKTTGKLVRHRPAPTETQVVRRAKQGNRAAAATILPGHGANVFQGLCQALPSFDLAQNVGGVLHVVLNDIVDYKRSPRGLCTHS